MARTQHQSAAYSVTAGNSVRNAREIHHQKRAIGYYSHKAMRTSIRAGAHTQGNEQVESATSVLSPPRKRKARFESSSSENTTSSADELGEDAAEQSLGPKAPFKNYKSTSTQNYGTGLGSSGHVKSNLQPPNLPPKVVAGGDAQIRSAPSPCGSSPISPSATLPHYGSDGGSSDSKELAQSDTNEPIHLKRVKAPKKSCGGERCICVDREYHTDKKVEQANMRILGEVNSVFLAKIYTLRQYQNLPMDPWIDRHHSNFETLIKDSWTEVRNSLPSEARGDVDEEPNKVSGREMKDCLGKFRTEANRKFRSIVREAYGLGSGNDAKRANKLLDNYSFTYEPAEKPGKKQFYHKAIVAAYADIFLANGSMGLARLPSSAKYFTELHGTTICFIVVGLRHGIQEYLSGQHKTIKNTGNMEVRSLYEELLATWDDMVPQRRIALELLIFRDAKIKAGLNDQLPEPKPWRNPYSDGIDDLRKDLGSKGMENLTAIIRRRCRDSGYATSSLPAGSKSSKVKVQVHEKQAVRTKNTEEEILDFTFIDADGRKGNPQLGTSITWRRFKHEMGLPRDGSGWYDTDAHKNRYVYDDATFEKFIQHVKRHDGVVFKQCTEEDFQSP